MVPSASHILDRTGLSLPQVGFGASGIGNLGRAIGDTEADAALSSAWDAGFRYFDTAPLYGFGLSELRLGRFLRLQSRADYVVSTKVGRYFVPTHGAPSNSGLWTDPLPMRPVLDYGYDATFRALEQSHARTGIDKFDVVYIHDLDRRNAGGAFDRQYDAAIQGAYRALTELRAAGVVRAIGFGINEADVASTLMNDTDCDLLMLAGRYTLLEQSALDEALPLALRRGIGIVAAGIYNSGILATGAVGGGSYDYGLAPPRIVERVRSIEAICRRHAVTLITAATQFPMLHPAICSTVIGLTQPDRIRAIPAMFETPVPAALWEELHSVGLLRRPGDPPARDPFL
ncbi:aldo/keto reductase [Sphingomonas sp. M1-B02]|uniref:aldo/keto reductase n=1 Tax=Sphingomonas sp. M1-B02 TaxID=3114300 RepID=UPI00223F1EEF|nr:aldo/keto reductase [Sphingomonas sp. S6-11]UZK65449.1 aldo/keto reductase [Sphingomonas sp. S6-11]